MTQTFIWDTARNCVYKGSCFNWELNMFSLGSEYQTLFLYFLIIAGVLICLSFSFHKTSVLAMYDLIDKDDLKS